jgi:hypothetical protein
MSDLIRDALDQVLLAAASIDGSPQRAAVHSSLAATLVEIAKITTAGGPGPHAHVVLDHAVDVWRSDLAYLAAAAVVVPDPEPEEPGPYDVAPEGETPEEEQARLVLRQMHKAATAAEAG